MFIPSMNLQIIGYAEPPFLPYLGGFKTAAWNPDTK